MSFPRTNGMESPPRQDPEQSGCHLSGWSGRNHRDRKRDTCGESIHMYSCMSYDRDSPGVC